MKHHITAIFTSLLLFGSVAFAQEMGEGPHAKGMAAEEGMSAAQSMSDEAALTVNVNEADAKTIAERLLGIGMTKAEAIVEYRNEYGSFYSPEELIAVKGIGPTTVKRNKGRILVE